MKTITFLELLEKHPEKSLQFAYAPQCLVGANYHITEVKHVHIDSVDCGARTDNWNETIIQLWESPSEKDKTTYMSTYKALGILKKVAKMKAFDLDAELKFEYGNDTFHTAQLFVNDVQIEQERLLFHLNVVKTDCKAKESCGVPQQESLIETSSCCAPGSGCC